MPLLSNYSCKSQIVTKIGQHIVKKCLAVFENLTSINANHLIINTLRKYEFASKTLIINYLTHNYQPFF